MDIKPIVAASLLCLAGCATLTIDKASVPTETAYQLLNAVDASQTVMIARNPGRYWEHDWPTAPLIGRHPSTNAVLGYAAIVGLAHYAVTGWLDREADATGSNAWNVTRWVWRIGTIAFPAYNVVRNHQIGLRPFGGRESAPLQSALPGTLLRPIS